MDGDWLVERFESDRARLQSVAYRLLGSASEADDAVQEAWLRLSRSDTSDVENMSGWLTTIVSRVCLDMLRSRQARREELLVPDTSLSPIHEDPEHEAMLAESVGLAMLAVLQRLNPAERVAFVLHDVFGVPFDEISGIVGRSPEAARQLASRGRRRVQGGSEPEQAEDAAAHREIVDAFFRASREGDLAALLDVLDPDVVLSGDAAWRRMANRSGFLSGTEIRGAAAVAETFSGGAAAAQRATIDGLPGAVWAPTGNPSVLFEFTIRGGKIVEIVFSADPARLRGASVEILPD